MTDEAKALHLLMARLAATEAQWAAEKEAHGTTARALMQAMGDIGRITAEADALYRQRDEARAEVERLEAEALKEALDTTWQDHADEWRKRAVKAEAEVERLGREADETERKLSAEVQRLRASDAVQKETLLALNGALAVSKARGKKLVDALRKAETFIEDDTCRHDHEKAPVLAWIRRVLAEVEP